MNHRASRGGVVVSGREAQVFDLVGEHLTQAEIGGRLFISIRTVESHVASLRRKLDLSDHRSLVKLAAESRSLPSTSELPHEANSFVGRLAELGEVALAMRSSRVVAIVGPGGTGKTRLALRAARGLPNGAFGNPVWVDLTAVRSSTEIAPALANALGVVEPGHRTHEQAALDVIGQRELLILLDNCEQILDEIALTVERMLKTCANVRILLTSRIRLAVPHEQVVQLGGLAVGTLAEPGEAVDLFVERALAGGVLLGDAERARVIKICLNLGGTPLAIELASARVASIGLSGVEDGLVDHGRLLVGGARLQSRHRSVRETVAWSYQLLTRLDQRVLCRVCTFRQPFSVKDAVTITAYDDVKSADVAEALGHLAQHSLLDVTSSALSVRYRMLETVRQFGTEQLRTQKDHDAIERHHRWCAHTVADLIANEESPSWVAEVDAIAEESTGALSFAAEMQAQSRSYELAHQLAFLLFRRGRMTDAQAAYEASANLAASGRAEAFHLELAAAVAKCRVAGGEALRLGELAAVKAFASGDIDLGCRCTASTAELIVRFAGMFNQRPPIEQANRLLEGAASHAVDRPIAELTLEAAAAAIDPGQSLIHLNGVARRLLDAQDLQRASSLFDAIATRLIVDHDLAGALDVCRRRLAFLGPTSVGPTLGLELKDALHTATFTATGAGQLVEAAHYAQRHAELPFLRDEPGHALAEGIAPNALAGNLDEAVTAGHAFLTGWNLAGRPVTPGLGLAPAALAMVHGLRGDHEASVAWLEILRLIRGDDHATSATAYAGVFTAIVDLHQGRPEDAAHLLNKSRPGSLYSALFRQWHAALVAEAAVLTDDGEADAKIDSARRSAAQNPIATALVQRAETLRNGTFRGFEKIAADLDKLGCPYQAARTLRLAGGANAERGTVLLTLLGATSN